MTATVLFEELYYYFLSHSGKSKGNERNGRWEKEIGGKETWREETGRRERQQEGG